MRLGWLAALVASVALIVGGIVGYQSDRRERSDERDEGLRVTTALSVAHVDAELRRVAAVLRAVGSPNDLEAAAAILGDGINVCAVGVSIVCSSDVPSGDDGLLRLAAERSRLQRAALAEHDVPGPLFAADPGDVTDGVVLVAVTVGGGDTVIAQVATRKLLVADVSLIPHRPLQTPRLVDDEVVPSDTRPHTRGDRRVFALPIATEFDDGARYVVASTSQAVPTPAGQSWMLAISLAVGGLVLALSLVVLITQQRRLFRRAVTDDLTGLLARHEFEKRGAARLAVANAGGDGPAALVFVDLDSFKRVNDEAGHHVGDVVLVTVAARLRTLASTGDLVARWGGDEFALLLGGTEHRAARERAVDVAAALRAAGRANGSVVTAASSRAGSHTDPRRPALDAGDVLPVSCSVGVATYPDDGETIAEMVRSADAAMYDAKRARR